MDEGAARAAAEAARLAELAARRQRAMLELAARAVRPPKPWPDVLQNLLLLPSLAQMVTLL